jgi:hypothetical protein
MKVTLPRQEPGHRNLKRQLQLPLVFFLLVLYIGAFAECDLIYCTTQATAYFGGITITM